ncbi:hypothetical protein HD553DRAFT_325837 [Filobasidium floriforme]|uniref:uncharacterized protein n=1 Tax=Filobasidium floriforme TaxID=5210 RepID=UPI001E8DE9B0|nr:uncharacterized protein HD553DRAFT_325837 [Filobasidium floriforme]KAH8080877.1 hypothetical protein HD553DRAFT_325837 [Filobasidium floriforme]
MSHHNPHDDWLHRFNMICRANIANSRANLDNSRANMQAVRLLDTIFQQRRLHNQQQHMLGRVSRQRDPLELLRASQPGDYQDGTADGLARRVETTVDDVVDFPQEERPETTFLARLDAYEESVKELRRENPNDAEATKAEFKEVSDRFLLTIKADHETVRFNTTVRERAAFRRIDDFYEELFGREETSIDQSHYGNSSVSLEKSYNLQHRLEPIQVDQNVSAGMNRIYHLTSNLASVAMSGQSVQSEGTPCYISTPNINTYMRTRPDQDLLTVPTASHRIQPSSHQGSRSIASPQITQSGPTPSEPSYAGQDRDVDFNQYRRSTILT